MSRKILLFGLVAATIGLPWIAAAQTAVIEEDAPDDVVTYARRERMPFVTVLGEVAVGWTVPPSVQLRTIPGNDRYNYAVVNNHRGDGVSPDAKHFAYSPSRPTNTGCSR